MTTKPRAAKPRAFHLPELLELFAEAPTFVAKKPQKAVRLADAGELMVESDLAEHMAAGLAPATTWVEKGSYAVFNAAQAHKIMALLNDEGSVKPDDLLDNHVEVMDIISEADLNNLAVTTGDIGDPATELYLDAPIKTTIAPEQMTIQAFGSETGVEVIQKGQILIKSDVLGILPYERPFNSLTQDADFLNQHVAVKGKSIVPLATSSAHMAFANALNAAQEERTGTNTSMAANIG